VSYGPGVVEVEASLAASLRENEDRNIREERGLREERSHIILSGGRTVQVPNDTFDNPDAFIGLPVSIRTGGQQ
jgi:hypothetical protein